MKKKTDRKVEIRAWRTEKGWAGGATFLFDGHEDRKSVGKAHSMWVTVSKGKNGLPLFALEEAKTQGGGKRRVYWKPRKWA